MSGVDLLDLRRARLAARESRRLRAAGGGNGRLSVVHPMVQSRQVPAALSQPMPEPWTRGGQAIGAGQLLILSASATSIASGGDYVLFDSEVYRHGFAPTFDAETVVWPVGFAAGSIQVEIEWDSYEGGGMVEIEVDGQVPPWGLLADAPAGREGCKRRGVHINRGQAVRIKVTQTSGTAQTARVLVEFAIPDPTSETVTSEGAALSITDVIAQTANSNTGVAYFDETFAITWSGAGTLVLANNPDGTGAIMVDDRIEMTVTHDDGSTSTFAHTFGTSSTVTPAGPFDVTSYFELGANSVRVQLINLFPSHIQSSAIWLVAT